MYAWGKCHFGQLGHGEESEDVHIIRKVDALANVKIAEIGCGWSFSLAVGDKGELYSWGCGFYGALGKGNEQSVFVPTIVPFFSAEEVTTNPSRKVRKVTGGSFHTAVITENDQLFVFGRNTVGQLGLGDNFNHHSPTPLNISPEHFETAEESEKSTEMTSTFSTMALGDEHSTFVSKSGDVFTCGFGAIWPQPAKGLNGKASAVAIGNKHTLVLSEDGTMFFQLVEREQFFDQVEMNTNERVATIGSGETHCLCATTSGKLYTWGNNYCDKLGRQGQQVIPGQVTDIKNLFVTVCDGGSNHSYIIAK